MEEAIGGGLGGSASEGRASGSVGNSTVNSRLNVDLQMLKGLTDQLKSLDNSAKAIKTNFKSLIEDAKNLTKELNSAADALGKVNDGAEGGDSSGGYMSKFSKGLPPAAKTALGNVGRKISGQPGTAGAVSGYATLATAAFKGVQAGVNAIDTRVDANKGYAMSADRMSVLFQQTTGMSQSEVRNTIRQPLTKYRLGADGTNTLMSLQARTGISATNQGSSVEAMRTIGGFGYSAQQAVGAIESMASPDVVNKMFMMTGTSMYGIGGKENTGMGVIKDLTKRLGLTNEELLKGGMQKGSNVRQRLEMSGIGEGLQDQVLQYAQSNVQFGKKGGKGMYDPSKMADRKLMGIEDNYATQIEETGRVQNKRDEDMYGRQSDNYAQLEKNTQRLTEVFGKLEDVLSPLVGARTSMRNNLFAKALPLLGAVAGGIAGAATLTPFGIAAGAAGGYALGQTGATVLGDPKTGGASPGKIAETNKTGRSKSAKLQEAKPVLREPLTRLLNDRPGIGIGGILRSPEQQKAMFLQRHVKTDEKTDTYYDGSYWKLLPGQAMAAPPGLSYHEIGLAADLTFASKADEEWLKANASKYGLDEFSRHGEVWHVQSTAYPASRKQYEEKGASFGTNTSADTKYIPGTRGSVLETGPINYSDGDIDSQAQVIQSMSISASMADFSSKGAGGGSDSTGTGTSSRGTSSTGRSGGSTGAPSNKTVPPGAMDPNAIADILKRRGFPDDAIWKMIAISHRESRWIPSVHNVNPKTGDDSYGLFQINMRGDTGKGRRKDWASWLTSDNGLLDPKNNIHAARLIYGGGNLDPWIPYGKKSGNTWKSGLEDEGINTGKQIAKDRGYPILGDPMVRPYNAPQQIGSQRSSAPTSTGTTTQPVNVFNVNPTINLSTTGNAQVDMDKIAKEITKVLERQVRLTAMRNS